MYVAVSHADGAPWYEFGRGATYEAARGAGLDAIEQWTNTRGDDVLHTRLGANMLVLKKSSADKLTKGIKS